VAARHLDPQQPSPLDLGRKDPAFFDTAWQSLVVRPLSPTYRLEPAQQWGNCIVGVANFQTPGCSPFGLQRNSETPQAEAQ